MTKFLNFPGGGCARKRVAKTFNRLIPYPLISTDEERSKLRAIEAVLFLRGQFISRHLQTHASLDG